MYFQQLLFIALAINVAIIDGTSKRGIFESNYGGHFSPYDNFGNNGLGAVPVLPSPHINFAKPYLPSVSPGEIAAAIQAAKEASNQVMESQQRVQDAKEAVLHQQHVASQKQAQAALALQKTEAAAAVQQQEAKSAATSLVLAQQRLAQAKSEVAEHQRIASSKEAHAAAIIQKSANVAAAEIQRSDDAARKVNALQHSGASVLRNVASSKDASLSATSAAVAAAGSAEHYQGGGSPWFPAPKFVQFHPWG